MSNNDDENIIPLNGLVAQILESNAKNLEKTTNTVIDRLTRDLERANAQLHIIDQRIYALSMKQYVANPREYHRALHVTEDEIDEFIKNNPEVDFSHGFNS